MTAEIAVLNKFGVALAADSAITVDVYHDRRIKTKVHNSANKLFTLSKYHPVGVMFYNTVTLSGIPWETIFKIYRKHLGRRSMPTIEAYAEDFFRWLSTKDTFFAAEQEEAFVKRALFREFLNLDPSNKLNKGQFLTALDERISELESEDMVPGFDANFGREILKKYSSEITDNSRRALKTSFIAGSKSKLKYLSELLLTKKSLLPSYSGIVFAGFGDNESLPKLVEYKCDLMILDKPRAWRENIYSITGTNSSEVIPLADSEVIQTLIQGISPGFENEAYNGVLRLLLELPTKIIEPMAQLTAAEKQQYISDASNLLPQHFKNFYRSITDYRADNYTTPIKQSIASLPVSELAQVAESFLGASQILKKVNPDLETIGGPVDVAVISKGDGFIWIKRKHYFSEDLNPAFKMRYFDTE